MSSLIGYIGIPVLVAFLHNLVQHNVVVIRVCKLIVLCDDHALDWPVVNQCDTRLTRDQCLSPLPSSHHLHCV